MFACSLGQRLHVCIFSVDNIFGLIPPLDLMQFRVYRTLYAIFMLVPPSPSQSRLLFTVRTCLILIGLADSSVDADLVCYKSKARFAPGTQSVAGSTDGSGTVDMARQLETQKAAFRPLHKNIERRMYFLVRAFKFSLLQSTDNDPVNNLHPCYHAQM